MRRLRFALLAAVALVATSLTGSAATAQSEETATLEIVKVVEGDGPVGGYVIEYTCVDAGQGSRPDEGGGGADGSLAFDDAGPGSPETQTVVLTGPGICTVTETDSNGAATVTYACAFVPGQRPDNLSDGTFTEGVGGGGGCIDDQSATIDSPGDVATITVTNAFDAAVIDDDQVPDADVVTATPTFTG